MSKLWGMAFVGDRMQKAKTVFNSFLLHTSRIHHTKNFSTKLVKYNTQIDRESMVYNALVYNINPEVCVIRNILGTDVRLESPDPTPIHILGEVKKHTHSYRPTSHSKKCTHSYTIFKILPIHILFGWKRCPIDILLKWKCYPFIYLEAWKVYPILPHVCIYLYNGSYPPWVTCL